MPSTEGYQTDQDNEGGDNSLSNVQNSDNESKFDSDETE